MRKTVLGLCGILFSALGATDSGAAERTVLFELFTNTG